MNTDNLKEKIGERLKTLRDYEHTGITQLMIADLIGCSHRAYCAYERGDKLPPVEILVNLAEYHNVSVDYILGKSDFRTTGKAGEFINKRTGLSDTTIKKLKDIHTWDGWAVSVAYDERHKPIDCINMIFESGHEDLLYSIYEYVNSGRIVIPDTVSVWDDTGTGHTLPASSLYRAAKLNDVNRHLNEMTP